jgi:hypothetical protein
VAGSFIALALRSRPLARMSGTIEPLLFASGLNHLLASVAGPPASVVEISPAGDVRAVGPGERGLQAAALLWPDAGIAPELGVGAGTAWAAAPDRQGSVYATLPRSNQLVRVRASAGAPAADVVTGFIGAGGRNPLPTGVAVAPDGGVYVTLFATEQNRASTGQVVKVEPDGRWQAVYDGLTFPVGLAVGAAGQMVVIELARAFDERSGRFIPNSGRLLVLGPGQNRRRTVVREINYPSALTVSAEGEIFFTEDGIFSAPGAGKVLRLPPQGIIG